MQGIPGGFTGLIVRRMKSVGFGENNCLVDVCAVDTVRLGADSAEPSAPSELFPMPAVDTGYSPYEAAPDGQRFLVRATPQQQAAEPLTVIVNWPTLLKKGSTAP